MTSLYLILVPKVGYFYVKLKSARNLKKFDRFNFVHVSFKSCNIFPLMQINSCPT